MKIPQAMKDIVAKTFYDKEATLYDSSEQVDSEGWARNTSEATAIKIMVNAQFAQLAEVQESYGIRDQIDVKMTTAEDERIVKGNIIELDGVTYRMIEVIKNDSHYVILGQKWWSKFSA